MRTSRISVCFFEAPVLCLLWLTKHTVDSVQLAAPRTVTAASGGSVTVPCQYDLQFKENTKYWCKGMVYELCTIVVKTPRARPHDRSSIVEDKEARVFTVTMTSLGESDEDWYWCVIARPGRNIYARVRLIISHAATPTMTVTQLEQDEISWWAIVRWILFILMLLCLASTHIAVWKIKAAEKV
ncbi:CMRF35-like molecule 1 isoform X2 [Embiotoca jacksoni]|uniref:CMRF35-like molecule 1 isoform X2 n=1 Tax=Embiotoca jacksoni TaxID=100190 RepID=UPI003703C294